MSRAYKRRKLAVGQVEDLTFDPAARQDYLTGFHKRKQARIQHARELAVKREREEKVKERRQLREQRKEDLEQHVQAVNAELKKQNRVLNGDSDGQLSEDEEVETGEWSGINDGEAKENEHQLDQEEEYVDEDKYTTVTVEPMGDLRSSSGNESDEDDDRAAEVTVKADVNGQSISATKKPSSARSKSASDGGARAKVRKKKFRYESKAERAATRQKQKSKNSIAKARRMGK